MEGGSPVYSATQFNVADTVTDATAELLTGTNWGDYQINVTGGATAHLRNTREDEGFDIGSEIQGIILETDSGLKVGAEHLRVRLCSGFARYRFPGDGSEASEKFGKEIVNKAGKGAGEPSPFA